MLAAVESVESAETTSHSQFFGKLNLAWLVYICMFSCNANRAFHRAALGRRARGGQRIVSENDIGISWLFICCLCTRGSAPY